MPPTRRGPTGCPATAPWARVGRLAFKAANLATFDARQVPRRADAKRAWGGMYAIDAHGGFGDAFAACDMTDGAVSLRGYSAGSHDHCEPPALPMR